MKNRYVESTEEVWRIQIVGTSTPLWEVKSRKVARI